MPPFNILVVDDFEPFRRVVRSILDARAEFQIIGHASDGLEAVEKAKQLRPHLILLDIGLPKLNGIETARRVRRLVPESKILFLSQQSDADVVQEALGLGSGYVVKLRAIRELLPAVDSVLQGKSFVSGSLAATCCNFEFDPATRVLKCRMDGAVTDDSAYECYRGFGKYAALAAPSAAVLDLSEADSFEVSPETIRKLASLPSAIPDPKPARIIVAPAPHVFGMARMFELAGQATRPNLRVVRTLREAYSILAVDIPNWQAFPDET
jgi:DNA-binding response OmpR family regulator